MQVSGRNILDQEGLFRFEGSRSSERFALAESEQCLASVTADASAEHCQRGTVFAVILGAKNNSCWRMGRLLWYSHYRENSLEGSSAWQFLSFNRQTSFNVASQYFVDSGYQV